MDLNDELDGLLNSILLETLSDEEPNEKIINDIVAFIKNHKDLHLAEDIIDNETFNEYVDNDLLQSYLDEDREALYL